MCVIIVLTLERTAWREGTTEIAEGPSPPHPFLSEGCGLTRITHVQDRAHSESPVATRQHVSILIGDAEEAGGMYCKLDVFPSRLFIFTFFY